MFDGLSERDFLLSKDRFGDFIWNEHDEGLLNIPGHVGYTSTVLYIHIYSPSGRQFLSSEAVA